MDYILIRYMDIAMLVLFYTIGADIYPAIVKDVEKVQHSVIFCVVVV